MSVSTPIEPAHAARAAAGRPGARQAHWTVGAERLLLAAASSRGPNHPDNEDAHSPIDQPTRLLVVADGVGSGALASLASSALVERLHQSLADHAETEADAHTDADADADASADAIRDAVLDADRVVQARLAERTSMPGAATLALCLRGRSPARWSIAWVGDCRVYRLPAPHAADAMAQALTRDDSYANLGEPMPAGGSPDDPARMVGNGAVFEPNVAQADLDRGEGLLLCSDGLHRHVSAEAIGAAFARHASLAAACDALVAQAREHGSRDDITVLALRRSAGRDDGVQQPASGGPSTAERTTRQRAGGRWLLWLVVAMLLLAIGVALAWWLTRQRDEPAPAPDPAPPSVRIER